MRFIHEVVKGGEEKGEQRQVKKERNKDGEGGLTIFSFHLMRRLYSLPHRREIRFMCTYKHNTLEMLGQYYETFCII